MKLNEINFVLNEAKLAGKARFVYHNGTKRLFIVIATHVWRNGRNRHVKLRGDYELAPNTWSTKRYDEIIVPIDKFQSEFTEIEDPEMMKILYEKSGACGV